MPALAVVEGQVDALVDEVLEHLVVGEVALRQSVQMLNRGAGVEARIRGRADGGGRPSGRRQETAAPPARVHYRLHNGPRPSQRFGDVLARVGVAEAQVVESDVPEGSPGQRRDAGLVEQAVGQLRAGETRAGDVGKA